jgi:hypothetical protein
MKLQKLLQVVRLPELTYGLSSTITKTMYIRPDLGSNGAVRNVAMQCFLGFILDVSSLGHGAAVTSEALLGLPAFFSQMPD